MEYIKQHKEFFALIVLQLITIFIDHAYFGDDAVFSPVDFWKAVAKIIVLIGVVFVTYQQATTQEKKEKEQDEEITDLKTHSVRAVPLDDTEYPDLFPLAQTTEHENADKENTILRQRS